MGILLGFRDTELGQAVAADRLPKGIPQGLGLERHLDIRHFGVVLGHADIGQGEEPVPAGKSGKIRIHEGAGDLPRPVGTEVEKHHAVAGLDLSVRRADHGHDEFVGDTGGIGLGHRIRGVGVLYPFAVHHGGIGLFDPLPAVVPVHRVVAAHHRCDPARPDAGELGLQVLDISLARGRRHVPAVHQAMDEDPLHALTLGQLQQAVKMGVVAVHPAVRKQTREMQGRARLFGVLYCVEQGGILKKVSVPDGFGDPGQFLIHHPAGADIGVAHLTVAHLPVGQTDVHPRRADGGTGVFFKQAGEVGRPGRLDGIAVGVGIDPETVHNDENQRFFHK